MKEKAKQNYEYINSFAEQNYDRITVLVPKGSRERIKNAAKACGQTTSDFIVNLIPRSLVGKWKKKGQDVEQADSAVPDNVL